jgi:predicted DNA-binding transcriptional regulator YafY
MEIDGGLGGRVFAAADAHVATGREAGGGASTSRPAPGDILGGADGVGHTAVDGEGWPRNRRWVADRLAALGGELDVRSAPGSGTTVTGRLPFPAAIAGHQQPGRLRRGRTGRRAGGPDCRWPGVACASVNRTDRLYALVEDLRAVAPRARSARQLAGRYEVSTRTIERDILALQEAGVPIYAVAGRCGGYVIDKALTLPPLNFTAAEMVAMAVSLARVEPAPFASALRSALRKVLAAAPAAQTAEAAQLMDRVRLIGTNSPGSGGPPPPGATEQNAAGGAIPAPAAVPGSGRACTAVPLAIQEAITARHVLLLDYRDRHGVMTSREVEPVAFAGTRAHWYLMAWCRLRDGARAFRLDRIHAAADTGEPAPQRSYSDLDVDIPDALVRQVDLAG